jgi:hypothetical protein
MMRGLVCKQIQRRWRAVMNRHAPNGRPGQVALFRDERRLKVAMVFIAGLSNPCASDRSKTIVYDFLALNAGFFNLALKIKNFCKKVSHIQTISLNHRNNQETRLIILEDLFKKTL